MFDCTRLNRLWTGQVQNENDGLECEDVFIFTDKADSRDLLLNNVPAEYGCIHAKDEHDVKSNYKRKLTIVYPDTL